jgi:hypothetical protein
MDTFTTAIFAAILMAPFLWPAFVVIYRYFRDVEDQKFAERQQQVRTGTPGGPAW